MPLAILAHTLPVSPPPVPHGPLPQRLQSLFGLLVFMGIAFAIGRIRGHKTFIRIRTLAWGIALQFLFGIIVVKNRAFLIAINNAIDALLGFTAQGAHMVFGNLS